MTTTPAAVQATSIAPNARPSSYPAPFLARVAGREKRALGDVFGLSNFGVNLTSLAPGAASALRHCHAVQDEFVYILSGSGLLRTNAGDTPLTSGMCAGFRAGNGDAHQIINDSEAALVYLEVGDRLPGDAVKYPDDDLKAEKKPDGAWHFSHKDGSDY